MSALIPVSARKCITPETIRAAAKQSSRCQVVPDHLRSAIGQFIKDQELGHMKNKVLRLNKSFDNIKDLNRLLPQSFSKDLVEDPMKIERSQRWKIKSSYGDVGLTYRDDQTVAYVAARMPSVFAACLRVLREIRRRVPDFSPAKVLDFGSGTGSAFWALKEVWPQSLEHVNLIEPSQSMQRAGFGLVRGMEDMPLIHSYGSLLSLTKAVRKSERQHDLVIASYVLGEIPNVKDRISIVRQLWGLTRDILVLIEPGTPEGSHIVSQMRSHILWMEKRKNRKRKRKAASDAVTEVADAVTEVAEAAGDGAFIIAPCPHDGPCPLLKTGKYCHFVQRVQRTESQCAYKRSNGAPMRGYEDEKFSYVVFRRGKRPEEPWPLDGIKFETLKEMKANSKAEDLEIDYEDQFESEPESESESESDSDSKEIVPYEAPALCGSSATEADDTGHADLGSGWGRIVFMPRKRGRLVEMDVCRATKRDGSEGSFEHVVITRNKNPALHLQARKSMWGDLWPY